MLSQSINLYKQLAKNKLFKKTINFNLSRIKIVLKRLNHPEKKLKNVINFIGSDGKYSVLTSLKYFIEANKQSSSAYISPSLKNIRERFWLGKNFISYNNIKKSIKLIEKQKIPLTIFEVLTVIFIINAARRNNDYNLIEAGALFAKDSTNVFEFPLIQAVVNINKQHLNFLKIKTLNEIIYQKVAFLCNKTIIYIGKQKPETNRRIKFHLRKNKSKKVYSTSWSLLKLRNKFYFKDKRNKIKLNTKFVYSKALLENLCMAIKIALDLKISKKIIIKTIPKIKFEARIDYINKGKLNKKIFKNEKFLLDGCHSSASAKNLANYLRSVKTTKYGIWGMMKNKEPDLFIKEFKNIFKKLITIPIENERSSLSSNSLLKIAKKNNFKAENAKNLEVAIKKISSQESKIICIFGSLYLCGNVLNKN